MGGHQYRLHNGMPAVNQPGGISAIKSSDLDNVPIVPGCTLLLRIMPHTQVRPNKEISVFQVTVLKILGRVGTQFFYNFSFFSGKKYNFIHTLNTHIFYLALVHIFISLCYSCEVQYSPLIKSSDCANAPIVPGCTVKPV